MANIGKLLASAVSLNSEVQASLASFNFDFALLKVEAPAEYAGVGSSLSKLRKRDAEDGTSHITARKLAALFADEIPATTALFRAYGLRATQISTTPASSHEIIARHGAFADHAGTDGTTIWAAATSGREALAIHLLACLLARIWAADEAVAVWLQLIQERKAHLQNRISAGSSFHSSSLFASKVELSRSQLAAWDANTRAWLSTADRVKRKEQTQLRLVIDNISLPVSPVKTVYESVMRTWTTSMKMMEGLLNGESLSIQTGELLLGLSSWHIYPNLSVVTDRTTQVMQHDTLVPEHVLVTVGLMSKVEDSDSGIHWSLPLAHLRYYGKPVVRTRHSGLGESRVPFNDLLFVALGSIFRTWQKRDTDFAGSIGLLCLITNNFFSIKAPVAPWLAPLDQVCRRYCLLTETDRVVPDRLIRLGYRYSRSFIASESDHPPAAFGLTDLRYLLRVCSTTASRIKLLRYWARKNLKKLDKAVIRYFVPGSNIARFTLVDLPERKRKRGHNDNFDADIPEHWTDRKAEMGRVVRLEESLQAPLDDPDKWPSVAGKRRRVQSQGTGEDVNAVPLKDWITQEFLRTTTRLDKDQRAQDEKAQQEINELQDDIASRTRVKSLMEQAPLFLSRSSPLGLEDVDERDPNRVEGESETFWFPFPAGSKDVQPYYFKVGIIDLAAVFVPNWEDTAKSHSNALTCDQLEQFLMHRVVDGRSDFVSSLLASHTWYPQLEKHFVSYTASLRALHWAYELYQHLPNAYVDLNIRLNPLHEAHYYASDENRSMPGSTKVENKLGQTFSCVALFETGSINIAPTDFKNAMALCHQDSIYVAERLLQDPSDDDRTCLITRMTGNIGKPGLSILHPPLIPEVRSFDAESSWHLANYQPFDGRFEDNFSSTSLHLSFTGSSVSYGTNISGDIHREVFFVETLIQAYEKGRWIADLDILGTRRRVQHGWPSSIKKEGNPIRSNLCAIDAWDELLGTPPAHAIFRAHNNWMARLAAVTILAQQQRPFSIISCDEDMPDLDPAVDVVRKASPGRRKVDKDAQEVLDPWLDSNGRNKSNTQYDNFEAVLGAEIGDMENCEFSDSESASSNNTEIGMDLPSESKVDSPQDTEAMSSGSPRSISPECAGDDGLFVIVC